MHARTHTRTVLLVSHPNVYVIRTLVSRSKSTEDGRVLLYAVLVNGFRCAALQREVDLRRLYECVLAQAVEGVLEAVQRADVWVSIKPTWINELNK